MVETENVQNDQHIWVSGVTFPITFDHSIYYSAETIQTSNKKNIVTVT